MKLFKEFLDEDVNKSIIRDLRPFDSGMQRGLAAKKHPGFVTQKEAEAAPWFDLEIDVEDPEVNRKTLAWVRKNKGKALDFHPSINSKKQLEVDVTIITVGGNSKAITTDWANTHLIPLIKEKDEGDFKVVKVKDLGPTQGEGPVELLKNITVMEVVIDVA